MCTKCSNSAIHPSVPGVIVARTYQNDRLTGVYIRRDGKLVNILKDIEGVVRRKTS